MSCYDHCNTEQRKRPAFQFYPGDWRKDVQLRSCSIAARGLWIDLMCVMHDCEPYGHLMLNGKPMTASNIAGQIGLTPAQVRKLIDELLENGVARRTAEGAIFSKRMVEDERVRSVRAAGGKAGAEHGYKGAQYGHRGGRPSAEKGGYLSPLEDINKPPPSSSSSSSPSESKIPQERPRRASRLPADWGPSPDLAAWAKSERPDLDPLKTAERFRDFWLAKPGKDGTKLDWDATWRNWVRAEKSTHQAGRGSAQGGDIFGEGQ